METPLSSQSSSVDTESEILTEIEGEEATINKFNSPEETRDLKLKELPLVHQSKKKSESGSTSEDSVNDDRPWITGGPLGSKNAVLVFRCSALSNPPSDPPANELHMTYKTIQAETKLLAAVLGAHGMREVAGYPTQKFLGLFEHFSTLGISVPGHKPFLLQLPSLKS